MPSEKVLSEKKQVVDSLKTKIKGSVAGVLVDYKGITVADDTKLRNDLRAASVEYGVVKNTLMRFAAEDLGYSDLSKYLEGTTAFASSTSDPVAAAKVLVKYADASKGKFTIKAGFVDGKVIDADEVKRLASLPAKEVLVAQVLGGFNAPISGFVNVLSANIRGLAVALKAIAEKQSA